MEQKSLRSPGAMLKMTNNVSGQSTNKYYVSHFKRTSALRLGRWRAKHRYSGNGWKSQICAVSAQKRREIVAWSTPLRIRRGKEWSFKLGDLLGWAENGYTVCCRYWISSNPITEYQGYLGQSSNPHVCVPISFNLEKKKKKKKKKKQTN
jgi:hypothetical protein